jgi:integrase
MSSVIFDQYEERLHRLKRHRSTITSYRNATQPFREYLRDGRIPAESVDPLTLEEYFAQLDRAPGTKILHLSQIGAAYRYAHRRGLVTADPTVDVRLERVPDKEPRIIPNQALRDMKARLSGDREWLIWHLFTYTGMRREEARLLKWENIKLADGTITVVGKGGKLRHIPIHPALGEVLTERDPGENPWVMQGQTRRGHETALAQGTLHRVLDCITRGEYKTHDFRRTVASSLYKNGVDGDTIDKIMGWSPRVVRTRYYVNVAPVQLQRAILKLYADDPLD